MSLLTSRRSQRVSPYTRAVALIAALRHIPHVVGVWFARGEESRRLAMLESRRPGWALIQPCEHNDACENNKPCDQREHRWWMDDGFPDRGSSPMAIRKGTRKLEARRFGKTGFHE
jgi:hypothetical protein